MIMSKIPKPKTLAKAKTVTPDAEIGQADHDELLGWLWSNLESVVPRAFSVSERWRQKQRDKATAHIGAELLKYTDKASNLLKGGCPEDLRSDLSAARDRLLADSMAFKLPALDETELTLKVTEKHFQREITKVHYDRNYHQKTEVLGFIDVAAVILLPKSASCDCGLDGLYPHLGSFVHGDHGWASEKPDRTKVDRTYAEEIIQSRLGATTWSISHTSTTFWFDVRATLPAAGQLARELKTLQDLADDGARIVLVCNEAPESLADILRHEGFELIERTKFSGIAP